MKVWLVIKESDDGTSVAYVCSTYEGAEKLSKDIAMTLFSRWNKARKILLKSKTSVEDVENKMVEIRKLIMADEIFSWDFMKATGVSLTIEAHEVIEWPLA